MKKLFISLPVTIPYQEEDSKSSSIKRSICIFIIAIFFCTAIFSQSLTIGSRSYLVMNGAPSLVMKDAALINNGTFSEANSTVKFNGYADTTQSYLSGTSATTFYNLTSSKSAYGTSLKSMGNVRNVLNVSSGQFYCDSNLTLLSDASLTARVDVVPASSNIYGKAMVQRYMPGRRAWRLMTAPVTSSNTIYNTWQNGGVYESGKGTWVTGPSPTGGAGNGLDASPQNNISMKGFNYTTQAFTNINNTKVPISSGTSGNADNNGYFIFVRGDRIAENFNYISGSCNTTVLTSTGNLQSHTQTFSTATDSAKYTLVGNPFASPIDFNSITRNNLAKRFFVLDPSLGTVGSWVMLDDIDGDGTFTKSVGGSTMTQHIQSSQAFFVVTSGNVGTASIAFPEISKSNGVNNNAMGRPLAPHKIASIRTNLFIIDADTALLTDGAITEFDDMYSAKTNLDDASKIANTNENLGLLRNGLSFSAERRPMLTINDTIFLKLWRTTQRNYRLEFVPSYLTNTGLQGFLEDSYLHTSTLVNLNGTTNVDFNIDGNAASADMNRFRVVFRAGSILPVTISGVKASLQNNNSIAVEWKVENEQNIVRYEIEHSVDGVIFVKVGDENVNGINLYNWIDLHATKGNNFYRIKIVDANGEIKYSSIVKVALNTSMISSINVYPTLIKNNTIHIQLNNQVAGVYQIRLLNNVGQLMYTHSVISTVGNSTQTIKLATSLTTGNYQVEIISPAKTRTIQKIVVE